MKNKGKNLIFWQYAFVRDNRSPPSMTVTQAEKRKQILLENHTV